MPLEAFVLTHTHVLPDEQEDVKLIGVFSTRDHANRAVLRARASPGFTDAPEGFHIQPYELDQEHWTEGFVSAVPSTSKA